MEIAALVRSSARRHDVSLRSGDAAARAFAVPAKPDGGGSAVNGGEFLLLALATCFCNDLYREAARLGIALDGVEVEARANFPGVGLAATDIRYRARVDSPAPATAVAELLRRTDAVAEVHNTVRAGVPVDLVEPA
jgi:organic hydroperoxide reductase OsmC/OhrA